MKWTERCAEVVPARMTGLLRTLSAVEVLSLIARLCESPTIFFSPSCREAIVAHLRSGRTELGGLLIGSAFVPDVHLSDLWGPIISIDEFVPSQSYQSSGVSLTMDTEVWNRARDYLDEGRGIVVGWYHSHPNLGAFFSSTDRRTQHAFFNAMYSVGLVMDPIRGEEAWFIGPDSAPVRMESVFEYTLRPPSNGDRNLATEKSEQ